MDLWDRTEIYFLIPYYITIIYVLMHDSVPPCINKTLVLHLIAVVYVLQSSSLLTMYHLAHSSFSIISKGLLPFNTVSNVNFLLSYSFLLFHFIFSLSFSFPLFSFYFIFHSIFDNHGTRFCWSSHIECHIQSEPCISGSLCGSNRSDELCCLLQHLPASCEANP